MDDSGPWRSPHAHRTAQQSKQPLGSAEITHPFHPLRGCRFVVLKIRRVSGVELLSLRDADLGSFAIAREWTDWAVSEPAADFLPPLILNAEGLLALAEQLAALGKDSSKVDS
jgi:hypothetical protein